ncbi:hypothetical protein R3P38DRAFT_3235019 [Favolaschia claudopus]|uniref:Uncharacterized protein n=1 Tax=Favolaschia claudopus TaxID=2862362 RepID=A0AAV9ZGM5_9AGAR
MARKIAFNVARSRYDSDVFFSAFKLQVTSSSCKHRNLSKTQTLVCSARNQLDTRKLDFSIRWTLSSIFKFLKEPWIWGSRSVSPSAFEPLIDVRRLSTRRTAPLALVSASSLTRLHSRQSRSTPTTLIHPCPIHPCHGIAKPRRNNFTLSTLIPNLSPRPNRPDSPHDAKLDNDMLSPRRRRRPRPPVPPARRDAPLATLPPLRTLRLRVTDLPRLRLRRRA